MTNAILDSAILEKLDRQTEQRLILRSVSWQQYLSLDSLRTDYPGLKLSYLEGVLEIMTLSPEHELLKKTIARLLEIYAFSKRIDLHGFGSTTYRRELASRGLEPDECYCVNQLRSIPDLAIEVVITSGGIDKLAIYQGLSVPEVWFWLDQALSVYVLTPSGYEISEQSLLFPELNLRLFAQYVQPQRQSEAVREFYKAISSTEEP
jgi:Uma2 family endonuclease